MLLDHVDDLPATGVLIGLDAGRMRVGIAVSDTAQRIASPLAALDRRPNRMFLEHLSDLCDHRRCVGIITGLPLNMDGSNGRQVQSVRALCQNLVRYRDIPVALWDERLSTRAAQRALLDANTSRQKRKLKIDSVAACVILQTALDYLTSTRTHRPQHP